MHYGNEADETSERGRSQLLEKRLVPVVLSLLVRGVPARITTESVTRLARPFSVGQFLTTVVLFGAALFPTLAEWHRVRLGLTPEQFALLQAYCYLALKLMVGILVGATVSWILLARHTPLLPPPRPRSEERR